jgi:hypothetical protein
MTSFSRRLGIVIVGVAFAAHLVSAQRAAPETVLDADAARLVVKLVDATGTVVYEEPIAKPLTPPAAPR